MFRLSLNRVHDKVRITESGEKITLAVDGDAARMVAGLTRAQAYMKTLNDESGEDEKKEAAMMFAGAIFGKDQAQKLIEFYGGDPLCTIDLCGRYFQERLSKKITKAQKK
jgi:hypothetical protein